jgi:N-acyl-D-amino-acid deacylase
MRTLITGGTAVDPIDGERRADVLIDGERIREIGPSASSGRGTTSSGRRGTGADLVIDADGLLVMPGAVDAHSHADARVLDDDVQLALLRSGVTTVITGQDGVSFAPGDGRYATDYFGALNGRHPTYAGGGVGALLNSWQHATRMNVGYLVPGGTVRHEVLGSIDRKPTADELAAMIDLVREGLDDGALGLSTGLDYVPGCFADVEELAAVCRPVAEAGAVYVSHIRGYEHNLRFGVAELLEICRVSGVSAHISHLHADPALIAEVLSEVGAEGIALTWDAYPYFRGFTLLSVMLLPQELIMLGNERAAALLRDPARIPALQTAFAARVDTDTNLGVGWADRIRVAAAGHPDQLDLEGLSLAEAGRRRNSDPLLLGFRLLADSALTTTSVMAIAQPRRDDHLAEQFALPGACSGSDGIYFGGAPHPRAYGCVARMYSQFGRVRRDFGWSELAAITSGNAARRFGLADRGRVAEGAVADLALVDPANVRDVADYEHPTRLSEGIGTVLVRGRVVLSDGRLTDELAGGPVHRTRS